MQAVGGKNSIIFTFRPGFCLPDIQLNGRQQTFKSLLLQSGKIIAKVRHLPAYLRKVLGKILSVLTSAGANFQNRRYIPKPGCYHFQDGILVAFAGFGIEHDQAELPR